MPKEKSGTSMPSDKHVREQVIDYIKANSKRHAHANFENYSLTQLIVIKIEIEVTLARKNKK